MKHQSNAFSKLFLNHSQINSREKRSDMNHADSVWESSFGLLSVHGIIEEVEVTVDGC